MFLVHRERKFDKFMKTITLVQQEVLISIGIENVWNNQNAEKVTEFLL